MNIPYKIIVGLAFWLLVGGCYSAAKKDKAAPIPSALAVKVDAYMNGHAANKRFNGTLLMAKGDSMVYLRSFGLANRELSIENSDSTKFLIGSITKPFTAYGILLLEEQGKLSLDQQLSAYLPDFPKADEVTIQHLLTHTSGITDYHAFSDWRMDSQSDETTPLTTTKKVAQSPFIFEPGARFSYTNTGYIILGLITEQVSGQTFESFMQSEIFDPLGLMNTGVIANDGNVLHLAEGYSTNPRATRPAAYINYNQPYASGNMYSTVGDLWKFTKAVMNSTLLNEEKTREIFRTGDRYGYGWGIRDYNGVRAYGHYGGMNGFVGAITYIPDEEYFICFLTNDDNTPKYTLSGDLAAMVMGKEVSAPEEIRMIDLADEMKQVVTGNYLVKPGDTLKVFLDSTRLYLQETGQVPHELFPVDTFQYVFTLLEFHAVFSDPVESQSDTLKFIQKDDIRVNAKRITAPNEH